MARISYINATCVYAGASVPSVAGLSLDIADGEFMVLVGPPGSAKSRFTIDASAAHCFSPTTGERLN